MAMVARTDVIIHDDTAGCIMPMVAWTDVINHAPTVNSGNTKKPAFPLTTTMVAVWRGRRYVLCLMRSELSVIRLQPSDL